MSKKQNIVWYNQEECSEQIMASDLPLFSFGKKSNANELSMLSLFSGCGGMDLGFEGGFVCHRKSIPAKSKRIKQAINDDWVLLKRNRFTTVFANDILPEAMNTWIRYMSRFGKDPWIYRPESIVELVKRHQSGEKVFPDHVDIVTGGFPCQDFSVAGKRKGFESDKY